GESLHRTTSSQRLMDGIAKSYCRSNGLYTNSYPRVGRKRRRGRGGTLHDGPRRGSPRRGPGGIARYPSRSLTIDALGPAPTRRRTSLPPWKSTSVGTERMPSEAAGSWPSSTSHFMTLSLPFMSPAISSTTGARTLQGPHHVAWKSTRTGSGDFATSASQV